MKSAKYFLPLFLLAACSPKQSSISPATSAPKAQIKDGKFIDLAFVLQSEGAASDLIVQADQAMRVAVMRQLKEAILSHYSLVDLKEKRIKNDDGTPFRSTAHLDECIAREAKENDTSDLRFMDRVRECIAAFQDTHFSAAARITMPGVSTGILLRDIGGHYYITARQKELLDYVKRANQLDDIDEVTALGNEVLEVDGQKPALLSAHYQKFVSSSSAAYRKMAGDFGITSRNYDYPTKRALSLTIKTAKRVVHYQLPWWASLEARERLDASRYFQQIGIPTSDRVKLELDQNGIIDWRKIALSYRGYLETNPLVPSDPFRPLVVFKDGGSDALRLGTVFASGQNFCYAEILTFGPQTLTAPNGQQLGFIEVLRNFVKECKRDKLNLVVDLRSNGGGNGGYPEKVLSLLTPADASLGNKVVAYRTTQTSLRLLGSILEHPELVAGDQDEPYERAFEELLSASGRGLKMTGIVPDRDGTTADPEVNGYEGKVIVLVTPRCISACDGTAAILKRSGRAVVIGTQSNGTGAGFVGSDKVDSSFLDTYDELSIRIPNYQFGYSGKPFPNLQPVPFDENADALMTENLPTMADVQVEATRDDLLGKTNSLLDSILKELKGAPATP